VWRFDFPNWPDATEWNAVNDPHATALTYRASVSRHLSFGLDVTKKVVLEREEFEPLVRSTELGRCALDMAAAWFEQTPKVTFHDPLAVAAIFEPSLCGYARGDVRVDLENPKLLGKTHWTPNEAGAHEIAVTVDAARFLPTSSTRWRNDLDGIRHGSGLCAVDPSQQHTGGHFDEHPRKRRTGAGNATEQRRAGERRASSGVPARGRRYGDGGNTHRGKHGGGAFILEYESGAIGNLHLAHGRTTTSFVPPGEDSGTVVWEPQNMLGTLENKSASGKGRTRRCATSATAF
jgi:hypothetical protein